MSPFFFFFRFFFSVLCNYKIWFMMKPYRFTDKKKPYTYLPIYYLSDEPQKRVHIIIISHHYAGKQRINQQWVWFRKKNNELRVKYYYYSTKGFFFFVSSNGFAVDIVHVCWSSRLLSRRRAIYRKLNILYTVEYNPSKISRISGTRKCDFTSRTYETNVSNVQ